MEVLSLSQNIFFFKMVYVSGIVSHLKFTFPDHFPLHVILFWVISFFSWYFVQVFVWEFLWRMFYLYNMYYVQCVYLSGIQGSMICVVDRNQILCDVYILRSYCSSNLYGGWMSTAVLTFFSYISHFTENSTQI